MTERELIEQLRAENTGLKEQIEELLESIKIQEVEGTPLYCPTCESCGQDGCCSPSNCKAVRCLYGEDNIRSYRDLEADNENFRNLIEQLRGALEYYRDADYEYGCSSYECGGFMDHLESIQYVVDDEGETAREALALYDAFMAKGEV